MDNPNSTGTKNLPSFLELKPHEQYSVVQKAEGKKYEEIVAGIKAEFNLDYKVSSLNWWFAAGGRLEQAYLDYLEKLGDESVKAGKQIIRRSTRAAATKVLEIMAKSTDERIQLQAAFGLLNKYVPDKQQIINTPGGEDDELPEELQEKADDIVLGKGGGNGEPNSPEPTTGDVPAEHKPTDTEPLDEPPKGETVEESAGDGGGEAVSEEVLQEPNPTDGSGDTPT